MGNPTTPQKGSQTLLAPLSPWEESWSLLSPKQDPNGPRGTPIPRGDPHPLERPPYPGQIPVPRKDSHPQEGPQWPLGDPHPPGQILLAPHIPGKGLDHQKRLIPRRNPDGPPFPGRNPQKRLISKRDPKDL